MSSAVGPINYAERQGSDFLGTELMSGKWHSEETAREIDQEIKRFMREAYERRPRIVTEEREAVERLTQGLLLYETLEREEIQKLIGGTDPEGLREKTAEELREERLSKKATGAPPGAGAGRRWWIPAGLSPPRDRRVGRGSDPAPLAIP